MNETILSDQTPVNNDISTNQELVTLETINNNIIALNNNIVSIGSSILFLFSILIGISLGKVLKIWN